MHCDRQHPLLATFQIQANTRISVAMLTQTLLARPFAISEFDVGNRRPTAAGDTMTATHSPRRLAVRIYVGGRSVFWCRKQSMPQQQQRGREGADGTIKESRRKTHRWRPSHWSTMKAPWDILHIFSGCPSRNDHVPRGDVLYPVSTMPVVGRRWTDPVVLDRPRRVRRCTLPIFDADDVVIAESHWDHQHDEHGGGDYDARG